MAAVGGSIDSISLNGRIFVVDAEADVNRKMGGFENEVKSNGDGSARQIKKKVPLSISGLTIEIDDTREDQEFIQFLANLNDFFPIVVTFVSGDDYQGSATITGEVQFSSQNATAQINLMGPGTLTKQ